MVVRLTDAEAKRLGIHSPAPSNVRSGKTKRKQRGKMPQDKLFESCKILWPECEEEYAGAVPGRRFRIDIAFPDYRLAVECDGWQHHGQHRSSHQRDRERQNLLTIHGWRILRFTAGDIHKHLPKVLETIQTCLDNIENRRL